MGVAAGARVRHSARGARALSRLGTLVASGGWSVNNEMYTGVFLIPWRTHVVIRSRPTRTKFCEQ
jgi:hypothetical protein